MKLSQLRPLRQLFRSLALGGSAILLVAMPSLHATDYSWASGVSGTWGSPVFWNPSTGTPSTSGDTATISVAGSLGGSYDVVLSAHTTVGSFTHNSGDASFQASNRNLNVTGNSTYSGGSMIFTNATYTTGGNFLHGFGPFDMINSSINGGGTYTKTSGTLRMENSSILATGSQTSGNIVMAGSNQMRNFVNTGLIDLLGPTDINQNTTLFLGNTYHLQNGGTIILRTGPVDTFVPDVQINGGGKLTNTGSIDIQAGAGGTRGLDVELDNQNAIASGTSLTTSAYGAEHRNSGPFYINAGDYTVTNMESWTNSNLLQATLGNIHFSGLNTATSHLTNSSTITAGGTLSVATTRNINNTGTLSSGGDMTVSASSSIYPVVFTNAGTTTVGAGGQFTMTSPSANSQLIIQPGATFTPGDKLDLTNIQLILNQDLHLGTADFSQTGGSVSGPGTLTFGAGTDVAITSISAGSNIENNGAATISGPSTVSGGFTNHATATLSNASTLNVHTNPFTNNGTFTIAGGNNSNTALNTLFSNPQTFINEGTFEIASATPQRQLGINLDNRGSATWDAPVYLSLAHTEHLNSGTLTVNAPLTSATQESFTNSGTGTMNLNSTFSLDGNDSNTALFANNGTINAADNLSIIDFENANNSGSLNVTAGTTTVTVNSVNQVQRFTNSGDIEVSPGATFTLISGWGTGPATFENGATLDGGGAINLNTMSVDLQGPWSIGDSALTATSSTIGGTGPFIVPSTGSLTLNASSITAPSTIDGPLTISGTSTASGGATNNGTATLASGARLNVNTNGFTNNGAFTMLAGSSASYLQTNSGQTFTNGPAGTFTIEATTRDRQIQLNLDNQGTAVFEAPTYLNQSGATYANSGTLTVNSDLRMNTAESLDNSGTITATALLLIDANDSDTSLFSNSGTINSASSMSIADFENANNTGMINITAGTATVTVNSVNQVQRFTNSGHVEVSPGATFNLNAGWGGGPATFDPGSTLDGGGTINFNSMSVSLGGEWSIGDSTFTATSSTIGGTGPFVIPAAGTATIASSTISATGSNAGHLTFTSTSTTSGGFTNNGTAELANGGRLNLNTNGFTNNGSFTMLAGSSASYLQTNSGQTFTNGPAGTFTIDATTRDRQLQLNLDNQGMATFEAPTYLNQSGATYANSGTLTVNSDLRMNTAESLDNSGTITATALLLIDGNDSNTALFSNSGTINSSSSMSIADFENANNTGMINITAGTATVTVNSVNQVQRFTNSGHVEVSPGATFNLNAGWGGGPATFDPGSTLDGGGTINFTSMSVSLGGEWSIGDSTFTAATSTIGGTGPFLVPADGTATITSSTVSAPATNDGSITFTATSTASGGMTNNGTAIIANGGRLNVNSNGFTNNGAFAMAAGGSTSYLETSNDQTFTNSPTGTFTMEASTRERQVTANFDNQGTVILDSPSYWGNNGGIYANSGSLITNGAYRMLTAESADNSGTFTAPGTVSFDGNDSATSLFTNTGTITSSSSLAIIDFGNTNNDGLIDITGGSANFTLGSSGASQFFTNTGEIRTAPGTTVTFTYGWGSSRFTNDTGGRLTGSGTFNILSFFTNNGTIAPGNSTGILTFSPGLGSGASTIYEIEVADNSGPGTGHDQLVVNGNLTLGGTLQPVLLPGFTPAPGDTFVIMTATGDITGNFASITQPAGGGTWEVTVDEVNDQVLLTYVADDGQSYADFQNLHFTPAQITNGDADPLVDFDGDGLVNLLEWIHGFDPTSTTLPVTPLAISRDGANLDLTYPESTLLPTGAVSVEVLGDDDLVAPFATVPGTAYTRLPEVPLPGFPDIQMVTLRITDPTWTTDTGLFFQLRFTAPSP